MQNEQRSLQKERRDGTSRRSVGIADAKGAQRAECPQPYRFTLVPSLVTLFTLICSVAERRSPLNHTLPSTCSTRPKPSAHPARYGRSARGSPEPSIGGTQPTWLCDHQLCTPLVAYAYKFSAVYEIRRSHVGPPIFSRATPRLTPSAIFMALLACESRGTGASFFHRLLIERRSHHTSPTGGPSRGALRLLRSSRYALTQPDAFGAGASRDGQAIAASLVTAFTLLCSVAERRSPLTHTLPLYTFYMFFTAIPSAHSASLRLCVKISQSPNPSICQSVNLPRPPSTRSTCSPRPTLCALCVSASLR